MTKVAPGKATIAAGDETRAEKTSDLLLAVPFGRPVYPVLRPRGEPIERSEEKPFHTVINSKNFHALQLLLFTLEGQVDFIYIDPPYNTGNGPTTTTSLT